MFKKICVLLMFLGFAMLAACGNRSIEVVNQAPDALLEDATFYSTTCDIEYSAAEYPKIEHPEAEYFEVENPEPVKSTGQIFLYGEMHGVESIMERQLEIWYEYYHNMNMRHLFIEMAYFTAEFLNMWMQSDNDDILYALFDDWAGTAKHVPYTLAFYRTIKREFPETIFHGTDVGHQYYSTGRRFLRYLEENNLQDTKQYLLTREAIDQGQHHNRTQDHAYRVTKKPENFIRAFDSLADQNIMAIHGASHTAFGYYSHMGLPDIPTLAQQLRERYGDAVHSTDLSLYAMVGIVPIRVDILTINEVEYEASYFGEQDISAWSDTFVKRAFWRIENAYSDFENKPTTGDVLPFNNFPMLVELGQVFVIDYTRPDGSVLRTYYRSSGGYWSGMPTTEEFIP